MKKFSTKDRWMADVWLKVEKTELNEIPQHPKKRSSCWAELRGCAKLSLTIKSSLPLRG